MKQSFIVMVLAVDWAQGGSSHYEVEGTWWLGWSHTKDFLPGLAIDASCRLRSQWSVVGWGTCTKPFHLVWDSLLYGVWSPQREPGGCCVAFYDLALKITVSNLLHCGH